MFCINDRPRCSDHEKFETTRINVRMVVNILHLSIAQKRETYARNKKVERTREPWSLNVILYFTYLAMKRAPLLLVFDRTFLAGRRVALENKTIFYEEPICALILSVKVTKSTGQATRRPFTG